jgi:hypothetical protein
MEPKGLDCPAKLLALTNYDQDYKQDTLSARECREAVQMFRNPFRLPLKVRVQCSDT